MVEILILRPFGDDLGQVVQISNILLEFQDASEAKVGDGGIQFDRRLREGRRAPGWGGDLGKVRAFARTAVVGIGFSTEEQGDSFVLSR